ncbi:MAG: flagellar hook protein FlgE [Candidatus Tectomicrobia bacterium]|nr:flagellar hook protein FlgE [Candidatus Tectomicrobia bacterium]
MSITSALFSGSSGLAANGSALAVIGNNIANVNTVGFKSSRSEFQDILSEGLEGGSGSAQIGGGVELANIRQMFTQGSFESTNSSTDLAIDGDGFFIMRKGDLRTYTRAGMFRLDKNKQLVNQDNLVVQGRVTNESGAFSGSVTDIDFSSLVTAATRPSQNVTLVANLDAQASVPSTAFTLAGNNTIAADDATAASNFETALTTYDSIGNDHTLTIFFRKSSGTQNAYDFHIMGNAGEVTAGSTGLIQGGQGSITFTTGGTVTSVSGATATFAFRGADSTAIGFDFSQLSQFASAAATTFQSQDGFGAGSLLSFAIDNQGLITGNYTNGEALPLAQISLARFDNPDGLASAGGNQYLESGSSGQPIIGIPGSGGRGSINSNSLELSNVDLTDEFVKLITTQRGFQANSRTITLTDELLAELVNLIR